VGVNTATGEGWGLVTCEHAATERPQIVPRHSACAELWDGAADLLPARPAQLGDVYEGGVIDADDFAAALQRLYSDPEHYRQRAAAARERVLQPAFRWECIAEQWCALFDELQPRRAASPKRTKVLTGTASSSSRC
jgi:glycosyltransferase involved in cell wall biosynthesis